LIARPWGRAPLAELDEWLFLAGFGVVLCAFLAPDGAVRAFLARKLGPVRGWTWLAVAFLVLCVRAGPFGVGLVGTVLFVFVTWLIYAVLEQGREMRRYVARRLLGAPLILLLVAFLSFVIMRLAPGGPYDKEKAVAPEALEVLRKERGYDKPIPVQLGMWMGPLVWEGDLGTSTKQINKPVNRIIAYHAKPSAQLGLAAVSLALLIGITAGLVSGVRRNSIFDYASMAAAMLGLALPTFIVGPMLVLAFSLHLDWFNVAGWDLANSPKDIVLPAITLALPFAARIARLTRAGMLEIVNQDYIRTARAKGLSEPVIVIRHTLKGTLLPVVSFLGPAVAQLLTGSLVVEKIFGVPGLGSEFVNSALNRDYELAMGLVVLFGSLLIAFNLIVDIAYAFLDPRIRHA
jgi:oligopeptide transport system permease protein